MLCKIKPASKKHLFKCLICISFLSSCTATTNLLQDSKIRLGMSQSQVCSATLWSTGPYDDPCIGEQKRYPRENAILLLNSNRSIFLVFKGTQEDKSELVLIASSFEEAEFFIFNLLK